MQTRNARRFLRDLAIGVTAVSGLAVAAPARADGGSYKVVIVQPMKTGDTVHLQREIEQVATETTLVGGVEKEHTSEAIQLKFAGTLDVLAVDKAGFPTRWKATVGTASVRRGDGKHEELAKPGMALTIEWHGGKVTVAADDNRHELSADAKKLLPLVFEASGGSGEGTLAEIVNSPSAESAGGSWSIDAKAAAAALHEFDGKLKPAEISGNAELKSVSGDDKKSLAVAYQFTAHTKSPAHGPAGFTAESGERQETGQVTLPSDGSTGYFTANVTVHLSAKFKKAEKQTVTPPKPRNGPAPKPKTVTETVDAVLDETLKIKTQLTYQPLGGPSSPGPNSSPTSSASTK